jgi:hypothetical protein
MKHTVSLSNDEALVISDLLSRFERTNVLSLVHAAELLALSQIAAQLDKALLEPFDANYDQLVQQARERLAGRFEGPAPGGIGDEA